MNNYNNKIELLAPAGNLEKLKIAYLYGADAVYVGGKYFSLRARANNFTMEDLKEASMFARSLNKKLYVTMNIVPHSEDLENLEKYLMTLESYGVTGIIVSSMYIAKVASKVSPKLERHLSTQASVTNSKAVKYYEQKGFCRVVLAREVTFTQMKKIKEEVNAQLEVFIHGGMCTSISGRCMLSNYMTSRDANRGGCAHSCRWNYDAYLCNKKVNQKGFLNIGSKDLCALKMIPGLIDLGIASLKIEGRMKSLYYIAIVVRAYRMLIDEYTQTGKIEDIKIYENEILKAENRLTGIGFYDGMVTLNEQLYNDQALIPTKDFLGIVLDYNKDSKIVTLEQRNYFTKGYEVTFVSPNDTYKDLISPKVYVIGDIYDNEGNILDASRHPLEIVKFYCPFEVSKNTFMRKK